MVLRKRLRRGQVEQFFAKLAPAVVGMEACGGAHHWGAGCCAELGHEVRLMPPAYVKPYVKRNKTDGRDAEAICEAMQRPTMRFVAVKSAEQQAVLAVHRSAGACWCASAPWRPTRCARPLPSSAWWRRRA